MPSKDKLPENSQAERREAMTLEEMEVKSQERKTLGAERKVDMNIILFVSLCLCGLLIINVVLYFLIKESRYHITDVSEISENARGLLKEREAEREAEQQIHSQVEYQQPEQAISDDIPDIVQGSFEQVLNEVEQSALDVEAANTEADGLQNQLDSDSVQQQAGFFEAAEEPIEVTQASPEFPAEKVAVDADAHTNQAEPDDIQFDLVISVGSTINDWSNAWSAQDVDAYLSFYAEEFVSEAGMNIVQWRTHRTDRLTKPEWISIGISKLKINPAENGAAKAEFIQEYNASNYSDKELKKMIFKRMEGQWKIVDERATPVE